MKRAIMVFGLMFGLGFPLSAWSDGVGFKLGRIWLEYDGFMTSEAGPPTYWDFHLGLGKKLSNGNLILDASIANYGGDGMDVLQTGDSPATLRVKGILGNLKYEFPVLASFSALKRIPILNSMRPYVGLGLGYLWKAEYVIVTDYIIALDRSYKVFKLPPELYGRGFSKQMVIGVILFAKSSISLRLEYQRIQSHLQLKSKLKPDLTDPVAQMSPGGGVRAFEILFNL